MTMAVAGLLVLFALVPSGYSLTCTKCIVFSNANCSGSTETCLSGAYSCATSISVNTPTSGSQSSTVTRGCAPNNQCNITGSLTYTGGNVAIATACCDSDNCTSAIPPLPAANSTSNSLSCSTCASGSSDYCSSSNTLSCTGLATQCGRMSTTVTGSVSSISTVRGCATPSVCNLLGNQNVVYADTNVNTVVTTYCSNGSFNLRGSFYLPAFLAFLLFKFLF
ncbi:phospholipase A2 inhibitor and Ly6/PLAUR domain-containing protein-like [Rana temporaria]|uniref:phospholipase A2 inhibitor and Ly6/PLAUR domain-containing protein-like n=1 Tax=Rana temporaria TaxID=8407 RepID=UPI001AACB6AF|nr:phospholipase A2 inhibitor and Ly6/PLAUR domain-containing protein-like [Rana temporaria]